MEGADPKMVQRTVPQSKVAETEYATCAAIDKHNRCRQDDLAMEKRLKQRSGKSEYHINICHGSRRHVARPQRLQAIRRRRSDD